MEIIGELESIAGIAERRALERWNLHLQQLLKVKKEAFVIVDKRDAGRVVTQG